MRSPIIMQPKLVNHARGSGRTHVMLREAHKLAWIGGTVLVVMASTHACAHARIKVATMDPARVLDADSIARMTFATLVEAKTLLRGRAFDGYFIDHAVEEEHPRCDVCRLL